MNKKNGNQKSYTFNEFKKEFLTPNVQQFEDKQNVMYELGVEIAKHAINKTQSKFSLTSKID